MFGLNNKTEIKYTDVLQKWRNNKIGEYNLFEKVIFIKSERRQAKDYRTNIGIIISHTPKDSIHNPNTYDLLMEDGEKIDDCTVKKYYGEMQSEFELLEKVTEEAKELEELEKEYKAKAKKLKDLSEKLDLDKLDKITNLHLTIKNEYSKGIINSNIIN